MSRKIRLSKSVPRSIVLNIDDMRYRYPACMSLDLNMNCNSRREERGTIVGISSRPLLLCTHGKHAHFDQVHASSTVVQAKADEPDAPVCGTGASSNTSDAICSSLVSSTTLSANIRKKTPISSLPVEVLAKIFGEVYRSCRSKSEWNLSTLASVCPFWEFAMLLTPEFWTYITFLIDMPDFSMASVSSVLVRSRNLVLQEVNFIRYMSIAMNGEDERARVMMGMQAIAPHMHRCRSIMFNVQFSSSLPSFPNDFHGNAEHLESLTLNCVEDDGGVVSTVSEISLSPVHREPFHCPHLSSLTIDGRNYFNAYQQNLNWTEMFPVISELSISRFTPVAIRSESFTSFALALSLIPFRYCLTFLCIDDLRLDYSPIPELDDDDDMFDIYEPGPETIVITNMYNAHCLNQIGGYLGEPSNLHITRCCLDQDTFCCQGTVSLKDIDIGEDLTRFLTGCLAEKLVVDGCPGFGDEVLNAMMTADDWWGMRSGARNVQEFLIHNCVGFSISALKRLVETRKQLVEMRNGRHVTFHIPPTINVLRLSGYVPEVSSEDIEWFICHVPEFSYDPTQ